MCLGNTAGRGDDNLASVQELITLCSALRGESCHPDVLAASLRQARCLLFDLIGVFFLVSMTKRFHSSLLSYAPVIHLECTS